MKNVNQIYQWATNDRVSEFLKEKFGINHVPCYYWILCLLKLIKPESLNKCFMEWVYLFLPEETANLTISLDGKTVHSTAGMAKYDRPLHIISSQIKVYSDNNLAYQDKIDSDILETGKKNTQKIERNHLTLRTRIKRLARKSICFSKDIVI